MQNDNPVSTWSRRCAMGDTAGRRENPTTTQHQREDRAGTYLKGRRRRVMRVDDGALQRNLGIGSAFTPTASAVPLDQRFAHVAHAPKSLPNV